MGTVGVEIEPEQVGLSSERLSRVGDHCQAYVDQGLLPGTQIIVTRQGKIAYHHLTGMRDMERERPVEADTIYRFYSMTKPLTSIAAMQLYEQGEFQLKDPIHRWIPEFEHTRVWSGGTPLNYQTREPLRPVSVHDLLTHQSGLTYFFHLAHNVDALYRSAGFDWGKPPGDLEECCKLWASLPLLFDPGAEWNYSVSTDVLGRLVEQMSGQRLDDYFRDHVLDPLGMDETTFQVRPDDLDRFAANYRPQNGTLEALLLDDPETSSYLKPPVMLSGGGGMVSTMHDYHRFTQMLLNGGELDGVRIIGRKTLDYMTQNHLPGGVDLTAHGRPLFSEAQYDGMGFGLGFSVVIDPAKAQVVCSKGEFAWGGAASTAFWVDPAEELTVVFLTQLLPSSTHPIRPELKTLVYQALL